MNTHRHLLPALQAGRGREDECDSRKEWSVNTRTQNMNRWMCSRSGDPDFHQLERIVFGRPDVGRRQICFVDVKEVTLTFASWNPIGEWLGQLDRLRCLRRAHS
jgi:hypothetical protein